MRRKGNRPGLGRNSLACASIAVAKLQLGQALLRRTMRDSFLYVGDGGADAGSF